MSKVEKPLEDGYTNALWNLIEPIWSGKATQGTAIFVAVETTVSQLVRTVMGIGRKWVESAETHLYSTPFIGPMNYGDPAEAFSVNESVKPADRVTEGGKQIIPALVGYTAMRLRQNGLKIPSYMNKDVFALMIGKLLSRPATAYLYQNLPKDFEVAISVLEAISNRQKEMIKAKEDEEKAKKKGGPKGHDY